MKKYFAIVLFTVLFLTGCSAKNTSLVKNNLDDILKNKGADYSFLKGKKIVAMNWNYFADDEGNIYDIVKDKSKFFSNNEKYRLSQDHQNKYDKLFFDDSGPVFYIKSDDEYLCSNMVELYGCKHKYNKNYSPYYYETLNEEGFTKFVDYIKLDDNNETEYIGYLKNGELYLKIVTCNYNVNIYDNSYGMCNQITEKWIDNSNGKILFASARYDEKLDDNIVTILTENGLYDYKKIETEESKKYEDVETTYGFVKNDKYDRIKDKLIYNDFRIVLTDEYKAMTFEELMNN